jgi:hypothetical protein
VEDGEKGAALGLSKGGGRVVVDGGGTGVEGGGGLPTMVEPGLGGGVRAGVHLTTARYESWWVREYGWVSTWKTALFFFECRCRNKTAGSMTAILIEQMSVNVL